MKKTTLYVQFPLCALAVSTSREEQFLGILSWWAEAKGYQLWAKGPPGGDQTKFREWVRGHRALTRILDPNDERQVVKVAALCHLKLSMSDCIAALRENGEFGRRIQQLETDFGSSPMVRLRSDLFLEMFGRGEGGLSFDEGAVLCAIYSVIGDKQGPVRITQATIRHRALGYKTKQMMAKHLQGASNGVKLQSDWRLRKCIERLEARKFFAKCTYGRRLSYYSHRLSAPKLREQVEAKLTRRYASVFEKRLSDRNMTERIRNTRASLQGLPLPHPDNLPFSEGTELVDLPCP